MSKDRLETFLELEMEEHRAYGKHDQEGRGDSRNGLAATTLQRDFGEVEWNRVVIAIAASSPKLWPSVPRAQ